MALKWFCLQILNVKVRGGEPGALRSHAAFCGLLPSMVGLLILFLLVVEEKLYKEVQHVAVRQDYVVDSLYPGLQYSNCH